MSLARALSPTNVANVNKPLDMIKTTDVKQIDC